MPLPLLSETEGLLGALEINALYQVSSLGSTSWVCKNAKPVALTVLEPLGSEYKCSILDLSPG